MSLSSRSIGTHNHLAPRKKHLTPHPADSTSNRGDNNETPQRERPFAPLKFESESKDGSAPSAYKSIFHL